MPWLDNFKPLTTNPSLSLYDTIKYSYKPLNEQEEFYKRQGYQLDKSLSNDNQQVLYNPNTKKLLYNIAGTHKLSDWGTDLNLALGNLKNTSRYKEADERLKQAKQKYGVNSATISGHSLGSSIGSYIAKPEDKAYLLNGGYTIGQKSRDYGGNHKFYRVGGDLVSLFGARNDGVMNTLNNKHGYLTNFLDAHNVEQIKDKNIFI